MPVATTLSESFTTQHDLSRCETRSKIVWDITGDFIPKSINDIYLSTSNSNLVTFQNILNITCLVLVELTCLVLVETLPKVGVLVRPWSVRPSEVFLGVGLQRRNGGAERSREDRV